MSPGNSNSGTGSQKKWLGCNIKICESSKDNCDLKSTRFKKDCHERHKNKQRNHNGIAKGRFQNNHIGSRKVVYKSRTGNENRRGSSDKGDLHKTAWSQITVHKLLSLLEHNSCFIWK